MQRPFVFFYLICIIISSSSYSQRLMDSVTSTYLKMKMPVTTVRLTKADLITKTTSLLDSFTISRDYNLNTSKAEIFSFGADSVRNVYDSLRARLSLNRYSINNFSGTDFYAIKKDSLTYLAVISTNNQQTMVSMKPLTASTSSQPYSQLNKIVAHDRINNVEFGRAVAISNNYAVVGAQLEDNDAEGKNPKPQAGAAYVYERSADNKWKQVQKITATDRSPGANFGWSVGISGNTIVVGAIYERFDAAGRNESNSEGAAYVFDRGADGVWKQTQKLLSTSREGYNYFGTAVGIDGNIIVVGAPGHSRDSTERQDGYVGDAGAVFVFERRGNNWRRTYKLLASDRKHAGGMGNAVAINGNFVIAGATNHDFGVDDENRMEAAGAAYIWERLADGKWSKAQKLVASDRTAYDKFGFSVGISGDHAIVGANGVTLKRTDENNDPNSGEAYIFSRNENGEWKEVISIIPGDRKDRDLYGNSVGISGNYAIVGSPMGNTKNGDVGVIYVYWKNKQEKWVQSQKLSAADEGMFSNFGGAVAIHKGFVISGAHIESSDAAGKNELTNAGAAYIFMRGENRSGAKANPVTPKEVPKARTTKN